MPRDICVSLCVCTVSLLILLTIAGCGGTASIEGPQPAESVGGPAVLHDIPGVPDPLSPLHNSSVLISGEFLEADEYASLGASWDVEGRLLSLEREGLSYSILGALAPVFDSVSITVDGELDGVWLGVSDYPRRTWRWLAGPLAESTSVTAPGEVGMSPYGMFYVILLCPDGSAAELTASRSFAFDTVSPPDDLGQLLTLPAELEKAYAELIAAMHSSEGITPLIGSPEHQRAYMYYKFSYEHELDPSIITIESWFYEEDECSPLVELIVQQLDGWVEYDYYFERFQCQHYRLQLNREFSRTELAWLADWVLLNYPAHRLLIGCEPLVSPPPP